MLIEGCATILSAPPKMATSWVVPLLHVMAMRSTTSGMANSLPFASITTAGPVADAAMRESAHLGKHAHLVAEVETRSGLVHHEERGLLHKRAGDEDHLALASRYLGVIAIAQVGDVELFEQRVGLGVSVLRRAREHIRPGDGAHHHHVDDEERKRRLVNLGDVADKRGHALSVALIDEPPVDVEPSRREGNEPEQRFEQRRLPTMKRAIWGMMRPIHPIMPATDTDAAVSNVAHRMKIARRPLTFMPMAEASSSPNAMALSCQRMTASGKRADKKGRHEHEHVLERHGGQAAHQPVGDLGKLAFRGRRCTSPT